MRIRGQWEKHEKSRNIFCRNQKAVKFVGVTKTIKKLQL